MKNEKYLKCEAVIIKLKYCNILKNFQGMLQQQFYTSNMHIKI